MPKLILQFEGRMLTDYAVRSPLTIGRSPDNAIVIDHPAVSGNHACVTIEGVDVVLEDLNSTSGTFVNDQPILRHVLSHGDVVLVGKHHLFFDDAMPVDHPVPPELQDWSDSGERRPVKARVPKPTARTGVLHVIAGIADERHYDLTAQTSFIGSSSQAHVRLHGWFKPAVAVAIARSSDGYVATPMGGKTTINDAPLTGRHHLEQGDVMNVSGLVVEFRWKDSQSTESAAWSVGSAFRRTAWSG
jgi:pSer/pThr/pTyr-binding forkhead associated (FHA) protein